MSFKTEYWEEKYIISCEIANGIQYIVYIGGKALSPRAQQIALTLTVIADESLKACKNQCDIENVEEELRQYNEEMRKQHGCKIKIEIKKYEGLTFFNSYVLRKKVMMKMPDQEMIQEYTIEIKTILTTSIILDEFRDTIDYEIEHSSPQGTHLLKRVMDHGRKRQISTKAYLCLIKESDWENQFVKSRKKISESIETTEEEEEKNAKEMAIVITPPTSPPALKLAATGPAAPSLSLR